MIARLEPAFMLINAPPFIQNNLIYPDLSQANQVAQMINSTQFFQQRVTTKMVRLPEDAIPPRDPTSAFMAVNTSPSVGLQAFYPDLSSCTSIVQALRQSGFKAVDAHVTVTKKYVPGAS